MPHFSRTANQLAAVETQNYQFAGLCHGDAAALECLPFQPFPRSEEADGSPGPTPRPEGGPSGLGRAPEADCGMRTEVSSQHHPHSLPGQTQYTHSLSEHDRCTWTHEDTRSATLIPHTVTYTRSKHELVASSQELVVQSRPHKAPILTAF